MSRIKSTFPSKTQPETPDPWPEGVVMRFLTLGGAVVDVRQRQADLRTRPGSTVDLLPDGETWRAEVFGWRCLGCGEVGAQGHYGLGSSYFEDLGEARKGANNHATACRAMPRPKGVSA